jgi:hypothetical protein
MGKYAWVLEKNTFLIFTLLSEQPVYSAYSPKYQMNKISTNLSQYLKKKKPDILPNLMGWFLRLNNIQRRGKQNRNKEFSQKSCEPVSLRTADLIVQTNFVKYFQYAHTNRNLDYDAKILN